MPPWRIHLLRCEHPGNSMVLNPDHVIDDDMPAADAEVELSIREGSHECNDPATKPNTSSDGATLRYAECRRKS